MRPETEAAIRAAGIAQRIADSREGASDVKSKGGIDLVTSSDLACEDAIRAELRRAFPEYPVIGEEREGEVLEGSPYWLVDPICGTRAFASNIPLYCSNIALVDHGVVIAAAIGVGVTGEILYAEQGSGAWIRAGAGNERISVGSQSNTIWIDGKDEYTADIVRRAMLSGRWYVWQFSSTISYAYLASGRLSGIIHVGTSPSPFGSFHTAAGCLIASEAGALVLDIATGRDWTLQTKSLLLAATPELQQQLSNLL